MLELFLNPGQHFKLAESTYQYGACNMFSAIVLSIPSHPHVEDVSKRATNCVVEPPPRRHRQDCVCDGATLLRRRRGGNGGTTFGGAVNTTVRDTLRAPYYRESLGADTVQIFQTSPGNSGAQNPAASQPSARWRSQRLTRFPPRRGRRGGRSEDAGLQRLRDLV